ncbi:MAG: hypothetical protein IT539_13735 [Bradyrhizobiaceae bacterium]|nr:hypothetical protein [Bradyrhizobiaceae bacterium]
MANAGQPSPGGDKRQGAEIVPLPWIARRRSRRAARLPDSELHDPDDYVVSTRTLIVIGAFLTLFVVGSVWLLDTMRKNALLEECLMAGRKNCTPIAAPPSER